MAAIAHKPTAFLKGSQKRYEQMFRAALLGAAKERRFAVPSAGALYPYELDLILQTRCGREVLAGLTLITLSERIAHICAQDIFGLTINVWFKPVVSVQKYGERGITYGTQDCGHLLANITLAARHLGLPCIATVFPFMPVFDGPHPLPDRIAMARVDIGRDDERDNTEDTDHHGAQLLAAMMTRRSASAFAGPVSPPERLTRIMVAAQSLWAECRFAQMPFTFHLAQRSHQSGWNMSQGDSLAALTPHPAMPVAIEPLSLFCRQQFTATAGALLVISAPIGTRADVLAQSLALGQLGQYLYLAAEMYRSAACCVGGFDYGAAAQALSLPDGQYAAYIMLFGQAAPAQAKVDRTTRATPRAAIIPFPPIIAEISHAPHHV